MKWLMILVFVTLVNGGNMRAQTNPPEAHVKKQLDSILLMDQYYRERFFLSETKSDSLSKVYGVDPVNLRAYLLQKSAETDSLNLIYVDAIINKYGYPGKSLVGVPTNEAAFYVIQHSRFIGKYLPLIKTAAEKNEIPYRLYATMLDRWLMQSGKPQRYGTQAKRIFITEKNSGEKKMKMIIWPIENAADVNGRRKKAGFDQTVEENAKRLNIVYEALTLAELNSISQK